MSDLFSIYEDSLNIVIRNIQTVTETLNNLSKEKTESALEDTHKNILEAERILKHMELEISTEKYQKSQHLGIKLRNYKGEVDAMKKRFYKIQENYINKKSQEAFMIDEIADGYNRKNQKQRLVDNEEKAWEQYDSLERIKRTTIQTEKMSFDIMLNLDQQGNQLRGIRENVLSMNNTVDHSNSLLNQMLKRQHRNKIMVYALCAFLVILFIFIIYYKLR